MSKALPLRTYDYDYDFNTGPQASRTDIGQQPPSTATLIHSRLLTRAHIPHEQFSTRSHRASVEQRILHMGFRSMRTPPTASDI